MIHSWYQVVATVNLLFYQEEWVRTQEDRKQTDRQLVQTLETEYIQSYTVLVVVQLYVIPRVD